MKRILHKDPLRIIRKSIEICQLINNNLIITLHLLNRNYLKIEIYLLLFNGFN